MAKNFDSLTSLEASTGKVGEEIQRSAEKQRRQKLITPAEKKKREREGKTQGRAGCKLPRITLAFSTDNHEFLRMCAPASGKTIARFVNDIIAAYREQHPELMRKAKAMQAAAEKALESLELPEEQEEQEEPAEEPKEPEEQPAKEEKKMTYYEAQDKIQELTEDIFFGTKCLEQTRDEEEKADIEKQIKELEDEIKAIRKQFNHKKKKKKTKKGAGNGR